MNHKIRAIYHILIQSQYGIWTINPLEGHLVLKVGSGGVAEFWIERFCWSAHDPELQPCVMA